MEAGLLPPGQLGGDFLLDGVGHGDGVAANDAEGVGRVAQVPAVAPAVAVDVEGVAALYLAGGHAVVDVDAVVLVLRLVDGVAGDALHGDGAGGAAGGQQQGGEGEGRKSFHFVGGFLGSVITNERAARVSCSRVALSSRGCLVRRATAPAVAMAQG